MAQGYVYMPMCQSPGDFSQALDFLMVKHLELQPSVRRTVASQPVLVCVLEGVREGERIRNNNSMEALRTSSKAAARKGDGARGGSEKGGTLNTQATPVSRSRLILTLNHTC
jgi:hypothetical protein